MKKENPYESSDEAVEYFHMSEMGNRIVETEKLAQIHGFSSYKGEIILDFIRDVWLSARAARDAEVRAMVEGMRKSSSGGGSNSYSDPVHIENSVLNQLLASLEDNK